MSRCQSPPARSRALAAWLCTAFLALTSSSCAKVAATAPADAMPEAAAMAGVAMGESGAPESAQPAAPPPLEATVTSLPANAETPANPNPQHRRQLIYTANLQVAVRDVDDGVAHTEALAQELGGWVQFVCERAIEPLKVGQDMSGGFGATRDGASSRYPSADDLPSRVNRHSPESNR